MRRLSLNQKTTNRWGVDEAVDGCVRAGLEAIGLWREPVHDAGVARAAELVHDAGLRVSSLCRGGFLTAREGPARRQTIDDNRRAIDEAVELGTTCLVMVVGGLPEGDRDLAGARQRVADGIAELAPYARERGVRLALEPMHPLYCADRGVLSTLGQALDIAEQHPADTVGVVVDTFHVWWDPEIERQIARARGRIASFQVCDWITPFPGDALLSRGMMGDGHIDFRYLRRLVDDAGYDGDIEVEIFNAELWATNPDDVVALMKQRYAEYVLDAGQSPAP
ncbi:sugar phosphate isomerase/epimerase [Actinobacteria bacterium YIM 96077]|uniref:Sugar phosphate isomerase/epimerase n=1 Tax=Phytoactinopolyspora halophila TaxID=1981511 RepID=A0A329QY29_9ACTN|nr:sugar phosphate isomerase/epimerase family protein [Phytoactinopolyspora halophila]AYY13910.1 sugar phosphate isomerase/epimerase [Actinobacteria bacterium YIM 96077]RAW15548.1 sugar phosphate isomerase/epimerase [Phytoactinopolyspora halophila]